MTYGGEKMAMNEIKKAATQSARDQQAYFNKGFENVFEMLQGNNLGCKSIQLLQKVGQQVFNIYVKLGDDDFYEKINYEIEARKNEKRL